MPPIQFLIERRETGQTVAEVLRKRYTLTWSAAKRLVERGLIRVAGQLTRAPEQKVKAGNRFWIAAGAIENKSDGAKKPKAEKPPPEAPKKPIPKKDRAPVKSYAIDIVYSDDAIAVVNKPAGLTTSRDAEEAAEFGTGKKFLPKTLAELLPALLGSPNRRVYPVHRLDRDTTGLLVFARNTGIGKKLEVEFRKRAIDRRYLALTRGVPSDGRLDSHLVPDRGDGRRGSGSADHAEAKRAITLVSVREKYPSGALVECQLETGRTHQVRIHLGEAGFPLCGERVYDRPLNGAPIADDSGAIRPMLHAFRLGLAHPESGDWMGWEADPPADFEALRAKLRDPVESTDAPE